MTSGSPSLRTRTLFTNRLLTATKDSIASEPLTDTSVRRMEGPLVAEDVGETLLRLRDVDPPHVDGPLRLDPELWTTWPSGRIP